MNQPLPQRQKPPRRPDDLILREEKDVVQESIKPASPVLRFSPTAWAKLLFFRDQGETEIGGFGIAEAHDLLRIEEFCSVKQEASLTTVRFDDLAVADFFEAQVASGRRPEEFGRLWLHTHPGNSPLPSGTDEDTFARVFGRCDWAVLFILARSGRCYARLRFNIGPGGELEIPVEVDYSLPFGPSAFEAWEAEYLAHVKIDPFENGLSQPGPFLEDEYWAGRTFFDEWLEDLEMLEPTRESKRGES